MSGDDRFDEFIQRAAADYNRPREVPRDAMWEAIRARREGRTMEGALGPRPSALGSSAPAPTRVLTFPSVRRWGLAAAAVLLLAFGIAIGRTFPTSAAPVEVADDAPVRIPPGPGGPPPQEQQLAGNVAPSEQSPGAERPEPRAANVTPSTPAPARQLASATPEVSVPQPSAERRAPRAASSPSAHQFALQQHLAHSEALLVAFRAEMREGRMDADLSRWARDLLSSTRLLIDSHAGDDPRRRRML